MMKPRRVLGALLAATLFGAAGYALFAAGMKRGMAMVPGGAPVQALPQGAGGVDAGGIDPATGRRVLYYHDPMVPGRKFDKPGKSPFMDMMLVPVYADDGGDAGSVTVSARIRQNLGVRTAEVVEGALSPQVAAVGAIAWNERDQVVVQARATAFVERLHVRATLDRVAKGQALAELYVPEWVAAQEEYLSVRRMHDSGLALPVQGSDLASLVDAARARMRQVGMDEAQIALVESTGRTQPRITLAAPIGGVLTEVATREGMTVTPGATLFRINGTGTVWANAEVPESQAALLRPGAPVRASSPAVPGATFEGRVQALLPDVDPATRTLKARLELANPGARLVPGMFVQMQFTHLRAGKALLIPTEAVIQTGRRTLVMLAETDEQGGRFRPVDVEIGIEEGGRTEVRRGLQAGQRVVVSSQFLIDSEASLKGVEARLNDAPRPVAAETAPRHRGEAKVESVGSDALTLSHGPIASLQWGAMTMDFKLPSGGLPGLARSLAAGDRVGFEFFMDAQGLPQLTAVTVLTPGAKAGGRP